MIIFHSGFEGLRCETGPRLHIGNAQAYEVVAVETHTVILRYGNEIWSLRCLKLLALEKGNALAM
jgi:hypothetical protein